MHETQPRPAKLVWLFAVTVFLSAFLLFQVQPMISKYILPWFGSTPGVWATALLFFQLMLLGGYAYVHFVLGRLSFKRQAIVHAILLGLVLITLPITPAEALKPIGAEAPVGRILLVLMFSVGAPFFLLAATAPLLQRWFAYLHPARSPYRLYALSNFGSLLALLSYPFIIEPLVRLQTQLWSWSLAYVVFALLCAVCGWRLTQLSRQRIPQEPLSAGNQPEDDSRQKTTMGTALIWLSLSACASGLLMATTNQMSIDIASVPFLWVAPLSLYLTTFILCFESERWYIRPLFSTLLVLLLINTLRLLYVGEDLGIVDQVLGYSATLFVCCMCCHGELARRRPAPERLTFFFLIVSAGGVLGGMFVALLAPVIFSGFYEFHLLLIACYGLIVFVQLPNLLRSGQVNGLSKGLLIRLGGGICWAITLITIVVGAYYSFIPATWSLLSAGSVDSKLFTDWQRVMAQSLMLGLLVLIPMLEIWRRRQAESALQWWSSNLGVARLGVCSVLALGMVSLTGALSWQIVSNESQVVERDRNFYGALTIRERAAASFNVRLGLTNGRIRHGEQHQLYPTWPTTYFGPETGVGVAIRHHPARSYPGRQFRMGVVGLGVGTLAAYANSRIDPERSADSYVVTRQGGIPDYLRFYELNPLVTDWARQHFSYLQDAISRGADVDVFEGDARIEMERQLTLGEDQQFDLLAIDAFSSDAIPIHLLTLESMQIYLQHLAEDGVLALHLSNRYVDLIPIVARLAEATGMTSIYIQNDADALRFVDSTDWVLLTRNRAFINDQVVHVDAVPMPVPGALWTDDFSSLFEILKLQN